MEIITTEFDGLFGIKGDLFGDSRGFFLESFHEKKFEELGIRVDVKQINFAKSQKGVLRGLHYQKGEHAQAKLVGCISGAVRDIVVDIRPKSNTYLKHFKIDIDSPSTLLYVPRGFAHGYYTLSDETIFYYAVDNFYKPDQEAGLRFDDPTLGIDWGISGDLMVSEKDKKHTLLN